MPVESNRLFFALWPTETVRAGCAQAARELKMRMQPTGALSRAERYHVTLLFLGDAVAAEQQAAALQAASRVRAAPFDLMLDQASSFRTPQGFPWWLGAREASPALRTLYEKLREQMVRAGVQPERLRFTPHLTILRDPRLSLPPTAIRPIPWRVEEFVLIRSHLNRSPVEYELLGRWPLNALPEPAAAAQLSLWG